MKYIAESCYHLHPCCYQTSRFLLTGYMSRIQLVTAVATASRGAVKGTLQLLGAQQPVSQQCQSTLIVPSKVFQRAVTTAVLMVRWSTGRRNSGCVQSGISLTHNLRGHKVQLEWLGFCVSRCLQHTKSMQIGDQITLFDQSLC